MQVSYDVAARATYVELHDGLVDRTIEISDLVMVDLDEHGQVLGAEFLALPADITPEMVESVIDLFPVFKPLRDPDMWSQPGMPRRLATF